MPETLSRPATYRFRLELLNEHMQPVHDVALVPADFHRAVEAAFFRKLREGVFTEYAPPIGRARLEPCFEDEDGSPRAEGFDVVLPATDGDEHRVNFTSDYFESRARRVSLDLVRAGTLPEKSKVLYQLAAYLDGQDETPRPRLRIQLDEARVEVPIRERSRREFGICEAWDDPQFGQMPVLIPRHVLEESVEEARRAPEREVGGVLLGHVCRDSETREVFLLVTCMVPAEATEATVTSVTFTGATWERVREVIAIRGEGEIFAGWVHSHPFKFCKECPLPTPAECVGKVLFYSGDDEFLMEQAFNQPFMVGLLTAVEPKLEQSLGHLPVKLYGWHDGEIRPRGFEVIDS